MQSIQKVLKITSNESVFSSSWFITIDQFLCSLKLRCIGVFSGGTCSQEGREMTKNSIRCQGFFSLKLKASKTSWITDISLQVFQINSSWKLIPSLPYHLNSPLNNWENSRKEKSQLTEGGKSPFLHGNSIAASNMLVEGIGLQSSKVAFILWDNVRCTQGNKHSW